MLYAMLYAMKYACILWLYKCDSYSTVGLFRPSKQTRRAKRACKYISQTGRASVDPWGLHLQQPFLFSQTWKNINKEENSKFYSFYSGCELFWHVLVVFCILCVQKVVTLQKKYQIYLYQKMRFTQFSMITIF